MNYFTLIHNYVPLNGNHVSRKYPLVKLKDHLKDVNPNDFLTCNDLKARSNLKNYYTITMPDDQRLPLLMIVEKNIVALDKRSHKILRVTESFPGQGINGLATFKNLVVIFFRQPTIMVLASDLFTVLATYSKQLVEKTDGNLWFNFSDRYTVSKTGKLYFVDSNLELLALDLTDIDDKVQANNAKDGSIRQVATGVTNFCLTIDSKDDGYYITSQHAIHALKKPGFRLKVTTKTKEDPPAFNLIASSKSFVVATASKIQSNHNHVLFDGNGRQLDQFNFSAWHQASNDFDLSTVKMINHQKSTLVMATCHRNHAYLMGVFGRRLGLVKSVFRTGKTTPSITNNCQLVTTDKRLVTILFAGWPNELSCLQF